MKRTKLNERDLSRIAKRVIKEESNLEDYEKRYSELVKELSSIIRHLESLAYEFEELSEDAYSKVDPFEEEDEEYDYDKEQMKVDLEDIAQSAMSYADIIDACANELTQYM